MTTEHQGPSSFEISQQMQASHNNARSGASVGGGGGGHGMLPGEGCSIAGPAELGNMENMVRGGDMNEMLGALNAGGGAFGQTITDQLASSFDNLGAKQAEGDNLKLENIAQGDLGNLKSPTVQGDLQMKALSMRGSNGGQGAEH